MNRLADGNGEKVPDYNGDQHHYAHESQRLAVQFGHACVGACFIQAALSDHCPIHFRERAVRSDHLHVTFVFHVGETHRLRLAHTGRGHAHRNDPSPKQ